MSEKILVILETDPETGMDVLDGPHENHRVACQIMPHQLAEWKRAKQKWREAQDEMAAVFKAHGGRFYGESFPDDPPQSDGETK